MRRALLGFAVLAFGCASATGPTPSVPLAREFELRVGQSAELRDELLVLSFERVASDSRCPIDAVCVWAGEAVVLLTARRLPSTETRLELHTEPAMSEAAFQAYRIRLVRLMPAPRAAQPIPPGAYLATLLVTRP